MDIQPITQRFPTPSSLYFASLQGTGLSPAPGIIGPRLPSTFESKHWTMHSSSVSSEIPGYLIYRNIPYDNGLAIFELLSLKRSSHGPHTRLITSPGVRVSGYLVNPWNHHRLQGSHPRSRASTGQCTPTRSAQKYLAT